jgi:hypothetical protein
MLIRMANRVQVQVEPPDPELLALEELDKKLLVARDRIRLVARGLTAGFYWHGRPGTGKTHTAVATLDEMGAKYHYHRGGITQGGLLEVMEEHADDVIVLDDVSAIFDDKKAVQYLLAALGRQQGRTLKMGYSRQGKHVSFEFQGGIICISNLPVTPKGMLAAFKSRVHTLQHSPSDLMLIAMCRHRICKKGWRTLGVDEVNEVIDWVQDESKRLRVPVDLRVILEKALPDFRAWRDKQTEANWKDLVTTTLEEEVSGLAYTPPGGLLRGVRQSTKEQEWEIVRGILKEYTERRDWIWAWKQRTNNKSERAFDRRRAEVMEMDTSKNVSEVSEVSKPPRKDS